MIYREPMDIVTLPHLLSRASLLVLKTELSAYTHLTRSFVAVHRNHGRITQTQQALRHTPQRVRKRIASMQSDGPYGRYGSD